MERKCYNCNEKGTLFYGFLVCNLCKSKLRLFTEKTVEKHALKFSKPIYQKEIEKRLILLEKDYVRKRIKLLDILYKLEK